MQDDYDGEAEFYQQLIDGKHLEGVALGITKQVIDKGIDSLSPAQQSVFDKRVTAVFVTQGCKLCSNEVPWGEMYGAYFSGGYCSYCEHKMEKMERE